MKHRSAHYALIFSILLLLTSFVQFKTWQVSISLACLVISVGLVRLSSEVH